MPTPEEEAQLEQWLAQIQGAGGASALLGGTNVAGASAAADPQSAALSQWVQQMQQAGGAQALFSPQNIAGTPQGQQAIARDAEEARVNALDQRYGSDLSWLDPSFQYQPNLLGQSAGSQVFTDPALAAQQQQILNQNLGLANSNLAFQDPSVQQGLMQQWAAIQGGQGAPSFMGNGQQQALMNQLLGVAAPSFSGDGDQRAVLNAAMGFMQNSGPGSLQFDTSGRQAEQYGNLNDIIKGGGATAIEMADRQRARADSESWLRGQREADMADYAERGLTGSGMELLNLASDRQAAAGRNSQADLDTAKALEERRLGAINSAAGLATNMRGQTIDEQGLLNNRATTGLSAASSLANSMRSANIQEQLGLNSALQSQFTNAANIAGQMRTQDMGEKTYLDQRGINALTQQTDLASLMRNQQASEQIAQGNLRLGALGQAGSLSNQLRTSAAQEAQYRANATDQFSQLNQSAINNASSSNTQFLQNAYQQMQNNRLSWDTTNLNAQLQAALGQQNFDAQQNNNAANQANQVGQYDANAFNTSLQNLQQALMAAGSDTAAQQLAMQQYANQLYGQLGAWAGQAAGTVGTLGLNAASGASGASGGTAAAGSTWTPTAGNSTQVAGAPLSNTGSTWASQGLTKSTGLTEEQKRRGSLY